MMKSDAILINTARGGIVNEKALYDVIKEGHLAAVGIDTFEHEPYTGPLASVNRCLLTAHMGSMSIDCRAQMEIEATREAVRFLAGEPLAWEVPEEEYERYILDNLNSPDIGFHDSLFLNSSQYAVFEVKPTAWIRRCI